MRISAKGEYAIKAMLDLAMHRERPLVPIQEIAARQAIPQRYLEQVLLALKRADLLTSKRGSTGGYHLSKAPEEITVGAVLRAVEGSSAPFEGGPQRGRGAYAHDLGELWEEIGGRGGWRGRPLDARGSGGADGRAPWIRAAHVPHLMGWGATRWPHAPPTFGAPRRSRGAPLEGMDLMVVPGASKRMTRR